MNTEPYTKGEYMLGDDDKLPRVWFDAIKTGQKIKLHAQVEFESSIRDFDNVIVPIWKAVEAASDMVQAAFDYLINEGVRLDSPAVITSAHPFVLYVGFVCGRDSVANVSQAPLF